MLSEKYQAGLANGLLLILFAMLAHVFALWSWQIMATKPPVKLVQPIIKRASQKTLHYPITLWQIFGSPELTKQSPINRIRPIEKAPETRLNLKLSGLFYAQDKRQARVLINAAGKEKIYKLNDRLPGNTEIIDIFPHYIVLLSNKKREILSFSKNKRTHPLYSSAVRKQHKTPISSKSKLSHLIKKIKIMPVFEAGHLQGFKLQPKVKGVLAIYRLRAGDIITHVNQIALSDFNKSQKIFSELRIDQSVEVSIIRNKIAQNITLKLTE